MNYIYFTQQPHWEHNLNPNRISPKPVFFHGVTCRKLDIYDRWDETAANIGAGIPGSHDVKCGEIPLKFDKPVSPPQGTDSILTKYMKRRW